MKEIIIAGVLVAFFVAFLEYQDRAYTERVKEILTQENVKKYPQCATAHNPHQCILMLEGTDRYYDGY